MQIIKFESTNPIDFIRFIKSNNRRTEWALCNGVTPTEQQLLENVARIDALDIDANSGYDMSTFDPLLMLVCDIYGVEIIHTYNGVEIKYSVLNQDPSKRAHVFSNSSHFWI